MPFLGLLSASEAILCYHYGCKMRLTKQGWGFFIGRLGTLKSGTVRIVISIINKRLSITISKGDKYIGINIFWG